MLNSELYDLTQNFQGAIYQAGMKRLNAPFPPPPILQLRRGYAESPAWLMVQASEFEPEPLTVEKLRVRAVWSSPAIVQALLDLMASEKWFDRIGDEYRLRDEGREVIQRKRERTATVVEPLIPVLDADEVARLEDLLRRVIEGSMRPSPPAPLPQGEGRKTLGSGEPWCLAYSRRRGPGENAPALLKIVYYLSDLNAYRDDAHMAAFQPHGIEAYEWETLTFVWQESAGTADDLFDQLWYRGYAREDYAGALDELARRGWVEAVGEGRYQITGQGRAVREEAERLTDEYFYAPWRACLSAAEIEELRGRMVGMCERLGEVSG
jgi:hypothetical protein